MTHEPTMPLSERELEVLRLLATGATNKEIAGKLVISPNTVKVHLRNIYAKIEVASRTEASMWAVQHGVLDFNLQADEKRDGEESPPLESSLAEESLSSRRARRTPFVWGAVALMLLLALTSGLILRRALSEPASLPAESGASQTAAEKPPSRWQSAAALPNPAWNMAASVYDGRIYLFGGQNAEGLTGHALRYDPAADAWEDLPDKPTPVEEAPAALLGEKIYLPGGKLASGEVTDVLEIYDPRQNTWTRGASLPAPRSGVALAAFEGRLYLFGGWDGNAYAAETWTYDPQENAWETLTPLSVPRAYALAVTTDNGIHLLGGKNAAGPLALHEIYAPAREGSAEGPWRADVSLPQAVARPLGGNVANLVYLFAPDATRTQGWVFTENSDAWNPLEAPPAPLDSGTAVAPLGAYLHFLGGERGQHWTYQAVYIVSIPAIQR